MEIATLAARKIQLSAVRNEQASVWSMLRGVLQSNIIPSYPRSIPVSF